MRYGVATARRAWLTKEHVANTRPWAELDELRKRGRTPRPARSGAGPGSRSSFGGPSGEVRSNQNSTPSRPSIAATALDWRRHSSATRMKKPVATTGTCGKKKPTAPARTVPDARPARAG